MKRKAGFQQILCSSVDSVHPFVDYAPMLMWWRAVLWLHGKQQNPLCSSAERLECVADGFRFYARLYRVLSIVFLGTAASFVLCAAPSPQSAPFWCSAALLAGAYLWLASGLGLAGARSLRRGAPLGRVSIVVFVGMIIVFLAMLLVAYRGGETSRQYYKERMFAA